MVDEDVLTTTTELTAIPLYRCRFPASAFSLRQQINAGGIADLYDAYDGNDRLVVVRRLKAELQFRWRMRRCFIRGVAVRRHLGRHPHIVQYIGEGGRLQPFEVIEHVEGSSLKKLVFDHNPLVREHPICILRQIARAMNHVHRSGYLHLDIKPENVMVQRDDGRPLSKLTDFDLCQPVDRPRAPRQFGGSLAYLPPEYLERKAISISTDVYAFGVLSYYLFTEQMPFAGSIEGSRDRHKESLKFPSAVSRRVTQPVRDFITRCLDPDPVQRFADDNELRIGLKIIARHLEGMQ